MTGPSADAAKLLPCPLCKSNRLELRNGTVFCEMCGLRINCLNNRCAIERWNTRPQPAPPAITDDDRALADRILAAIHNGNEMDHATAAQVISEWRTAELDAVLARAGWALFDATKNYPTGCQSPGWVQECVEAQRLIAEYQRARRLGLAARPKVEDAEVAEQIRLARQWPRDCEGALINKLADLLERRSAEASDNLKAAQGMSADVTNLGRQLEAVQDDLRTKETQLAQADAVIYSLWEKDATINPAERTKLEKSRARHQSRQQAAKDNA